MVHEDVVRIDLALPREDAEVQYAERFWFALQARHDCVRAVQRFIGTIGIHPEAAAIPPEIGSHDQGQQGREGDDTHAPPLTPEHE